MTIKVNKPMTDTVTFVMTKVRDAYGTALVIKGWI